MWHLTRQIFAPEDGQRFNPDKARAIELVIIKPITMRETGKKTKKPQFVTPNKTIQGPDPEPGPIITPFAIAYKIPSSKIEGLLVEDQDTDTSSRELIGLQIEFRTEVVDPEEGSSWPLLPHLRLAQVYFNSAPGLNGSYFERVDDFDGNHIQLTLEETYSVVVNQDPNSEEEWSSLVQFVPPPQTETIQLYKKLDFYTGIGFVYFSVGQLRFLTHFYNELIISGCQLNMGRKLHHPDLNAEIAEKRFPEGSFSLKIEGSGATSNIRVNEGSDAKSRTVMNATEGADIAIGHPCPPKWETFLVTLGEIMGRYPNINLFALIPALWDDWNTYVVRVTGGEEVDNDPEN